MKTGYPIWRAAAVLAALAAATPAAAQSPDTGTIAGQVTLASTGEPAHGASVIVVGARRTGVTAEDGTFTIRDVPPGDWEVVAEREHFAAARQRVTVAAGGTASVTFELSLAAVHEEVTVSASPGGAVTAFDAFNAVATVDSTELAMHRGATITEALERQPGVTTRSFGAGSSRPIIRGFDGDRILIMQDGLRTGDLSSQSGDHGVTLDPAGLERIEVVRGPATLLYGSNAIGGVVNAITPQDAFRTTPFDGLLGTATVDAGSANAQAGGSAGVQVGRGQWLYWANAGSRRTGDVATPAGPIPNSATELTSGRAGLAWSGNRWFWSLGGQFEDGRFGIPFAGAFHHHDDEGDADDEEDHEHEAEEEDLDVDIASTRRDARVDVGVRRASGFLDHVTLTMAYTDYGHEEIEIEDGAEAVGTVFDNDTLTARVELAQRRQGRLSGRLGVELFGRDFRATGAEALAPPTSHTSLAAFAYEELDFGRVRVQFGGRLERNSYDAGARAGDDHEHEEADEGAHADEHEAPAPRDRSFTGASGSVGLHAGLGSSGALVVNVSAASRAPALEELYNFGPHVGNLAFEIGNPDLDLERTLGLDVSLRSRSDRLRGEVNLFVYDIANFVFLDFTGDERDGLREAAFAQGDSRFAGMEARASIDLASTVHLHAGASLVRARLTATDEPLPRIPPVSGRLGLEWSWRAFTVEPEVVFAAAQRDVFRDEATTDGWATVNLGARWLAVRGHTTHSVTLLAFNLADREYRRHTSFTKALAPEIGRGLRMSYTLRFF